jgi:hypothetical protein
MGKLVRKRRAEINFQCFHPIQVPEEGIFRFFSMKGAIVVP